MEGTLHVDDRKLHLAVPFCYSLQSYTMSLESSRDMTISHQ